MRTKMTFALLLIIVPALFILWLRRQWQGYPEKGSVAYNLFWWWNDIKPAPVLTQEQRDRNMADLLEGRPVEDWEVADILADDAERRARLLERLG